MVDHSQMKLGKLAPRPVAKKLELSDYVKRALPKPPSALDLTARLPASLGMMLNDNLGDCTIACPGHLTQVWTSLTGTEITISDADILKAYEGACGYKPGHPETDQGGIIADVLDYWRDTGIGGHKIRAHAPVHRQIKNLELGVDIFGGLDIGVALPITAQSQDVWDVVPHGGRDAEPNSWGGHCVGVPVYGDGYFECITWGGRKKMTHAFFRKYCDEAHVIISDDWITAGKCPDGFSLDDMLADIKSL